jgi:phosphatidylglycerol:prolipoprotein diacylglycerol transferase
MHPILFKIGPLQLYTYGALLAVAFLVAIFLASKEAERQGLDKSFASDMGVVVIVSSVIGARLFYILFYDLRYTLQHPTELLKLRQTGLVFYGGFIFAVAAGIIYTRLKRASIPVVLDIAAPSIAIGQAIGRIGCLMSGCCYGKPTWVPWGIKFPHVDYRVHPTQIYEALATFLIFLLLVWFRRHKTRDGQIAWLYMVTYAMARFVIEFFRGDNPHIAFGLTLSQIISVVALVAAVPLGYVVWFSAGQRKDQESAGKKA